MKLNIKPFQIYFISNYSWRSFTITTSFWLPKLCQNDNSKEIIKRWRNSSALDFPVFLSSSSLCVELVLFIQYEIGSGSVFFFFSFHSLLYFLVESGRSGGSCGQLPTSAVRKTVQFKTRAKYTGASLFISRLPQRRARRRDERNEGSGRPPLDLLSS